MPKPRYIHPSISMINPVYNSIRANNDLPDTGFCEFWHNTPHLWEIRKALCAADQQTSKCNRSLRGIHRNITNNVSEVSAG